MSGVNPDFTYRLLVDAGLRQGMRILDVGCGFGDVTYLAAALAGEAGSVVGVDRDDDALVRARQRIAPHGVPRPVFTQGDIHSLPDALGSFDAIVGRRVLMYQPDTVQVVRALAERLRPGGVIVFQEHDNTMVPASLLPFPLHAQAQNWLRGMIEREGADLHIGFNLHGVLTRAGLTVESVRAESVVQTPTAAYGLGGIVRACLPRIIAHEVATAEEVGIDTLQERLDVERAGTDAIYIGDMMFGAWARKYAKIA